MKILVTGYKGFLGSKFVTIYGKLFEIIGFDRVDGDELSDFDLLSHKIKGCEMVVHLAAIPYPQDERPFEDYFDINVRGTLNVLKAASENKLKRVIYASSTTIYGIESGIPFQTPIKENQPFISQYIGADKLSCRDCDLSYHMSKVMAEQILAWYGLNKKIQTVALRFGPIDVVFLGTSVTSNNATQAIKLALEYKGELWYEPFSIVDEIPHIDISKAKRILGYIPEKPNYPKDRIISTLENRTQL